MSFLRALLGRSKPVQPDLDALFGLPSAAVTLEATAGFRPTGTGSVAFRAAEGRAFADLQRETTELLDADGGPATEAVADDYGYTWLVVRAPVAGGLGDLVTDIHAVNSSLENAGFGPSLLCSLAAFTDAPAGAEGGGGAGGRTVALVYLYKRGTFYPFAPLGGQRRDNALELQLAAAVGKDLPIEQDKGRWFPVYGAPGL
ncbi:PspA-associated protein PspAB [Nocardiopsis coralliicola]